MVVNTHELNHPKKKEVIPFQANKNLSLPEDDNKITVWDLPVWARRTQVFETVYFLERVEHIEMIKSTTDKTRAEVEFQTGTFDKRKMSEIWCLPFVNESLVRISIGTNNYPLLHTRNRFSKRLLDLLENTNEVLLWRQIKRSGARALHIFKNSNNNNMRSATVYFEKEEDMLNSSKFLMSYYDNKLRWANSTRQEAELRNKKAINQEELEIYKKSSTKGFGPRKKTEQDQKGFIKLISSEEEILVNTEQRMKTLQKSAYSKKKKKRYEKAKRKKFIVKHLAVYYHIKNRIQVQKLLLTTCYNS